MVAATKYYQFVENLGLGVYNLNTDALKIALTNQAITQTNAVLADLTQIANGNGYTTGGQAVDSQSWSETTGTASLAYADEVFTSSGAGMAAFRTAALYDDTPTSPADPLIVAWDNGSSITLAVGETCTIDVGSAVATLV